jgi:hypothetical protein
VDRLANLDFSTEQLEKASQVRTTIVDLPGWTLAEATEDGINIDLNANGFGWYVDSTPNDDSEFAHEGDQLRAIEGTEADGRVDLLTVLTHELGHYLGLKHTDAETEQLTATNAFMQSGIRPGIRRLPGIESDSSGNTIIIDQLTETLKGANAPPEIAKLEINPTISWISNTSGFWDVAANWQDTGGVSRLPNATDDVLIDRGTNNPTITIRSGTQSVRALLSNESLVISGGTLSLGATSEIDADFTLSTGTLQGTGALTVNGN